MYSFFVGVSIAADREIWTRKSMPPLWVKMLFMGNILNKNYRFIDKSLIKTFYCKILNECNLATLTTNDDDILKAFYGIKVFMMLFQIK